MKKVWYDVIYWPHLEWEKSEFVIQFKENSRWSVWRGATIYKQFHVIKFCE